MKKSELKMMVREIVREEVAMSIQEVISELKRPLTDNNKSLSKNNIVEKKYYTNNSVLNEVLNETVGGIPGDGSSSEMLQEAYSGIDGGEIDGTQMLNSFGKDVSKVDTKTKDALTRNYSDLMKTINEKKKG